MSETRNYSKGAWLTGGQMEMNEWNRSRSRWIDCKPDTDLTWCKKLTGNVFVRKMFSYADFANKSVLEIGPGYGRILKTLVEQNPGFNRYLGLDISKNNIEYLSENIPQCKQQDIFFAHGDIETCNFGNWKFDIVYSSLTFKHFFPDFSIALKKISDVLNDKGIVMFDIPEGSKTNWEPSNTFIHLYNESEVGKIVLDAGLEIVNICKVKHDPEHERLFVVAQKGYVKIETVDDIMGTFHRTNFGQEPREWRIYMDFLRTYYADRRISNPIVVEIGIWTGLQRRFYEILLNAEYIGIDMSDEFVQPNILGNSRSPKVFSALKEKLCGRKIDLLFIDGAHCYEGVKADYELYAPLVKHIVALHDVNTTPLKTDVEPVEVIKFWKELLATDKENTLLTIQHHNRLDSGIFNIGRQMGIGLVIKPEGLK